MIVLFRVLVLAIGLMSGVPEVPAADDVRVEIGVDAHVEDGTLHIDGRATVPDGAWIIYVAYRTEAPGRRVTGYARVADRRYRTRADIAQWPAGEIAVDVHFQMRLPGRRQPEHVIATFGASGERMTGERVVRGGGSFRAAVASATAYKPR